MFDFLLNDFKRRDDCVNFRSMTAEARSKSIREPGPITPLPCLSAKGAEDNGSGGRCKSQQIPDQPAVKLINTINTQKGVPS